MAPHRNWLLSTALASARIGVSTSVLLLGRDSRFGTSHCTRMPECCRRAIKTCQPRTALHNARPPNRADQLPFCLVVPRKGPGSPCNAWTLVVCEKLALPHVPSDTERRLPVHLSSMTWLHLPLNFPASRLWAYFNTTFLYTSSPVVDSPG